MTDHEPFLVLASRQLHERLTDAEAELLQRHLDGCPSCRRQAAAMRHDQAALASLVTDAPVSERVRRTVLDAAQGRRRTDLRVLLAAAALLVLSAAGVVAVAGGLPNRPTVIPSATPSGPPATTGFVNGAYAYTVSPGETRRDSITARLGADPLGEWTRMSPASGGGPALGGPVTCLVIEGREAWLAGPATTATDGSTDRAAFLYVRDGGPGGANDAAVLWVTDPGQTLATMEGWCTSRFIPAGPYPLDDGDVTVTSGTESPAGSPPASP